MKSRFSSTILPPWCRKSPQITEVLPLLYLHGLSSLDFGPALERFLGTGAGLSAASITRLTSQWQDEAKAFNARDLSGVDYVYLWADGIHVNIRLEQERLCLLVLVGVRADGTKELIALTDGHRESAGSWADLLRDAKRRGMRAPVLAMGDGALGFWSALREVFPTTREQRCWFHKIANVLAALPKSAHPGASPCRATPKGQTFISCTARRSPTITHSSRPPTLVAHQVLTIPPRPTHRCGTARSPILCTQSRDVVCAAVRICVTDSAHGPSVTRDLG